MHGVRSAALTAAGLATLVSVSGCSLQSTETEIRVPQTAATETDRDACEGVYVVTDLGPDFSTIHGSCIATDTPIVAIDAFTRAGIPVSEGEAFPGSVCRVVGYPDASTVLSYNDQRFTEECREISPAWAYWALFIDAGAGWLNAEDGASTQQVRPGETVAFAWQYGDPSITRLPKLPE